MRPAERQSPATVSQIAEGSGVDMSVASRHLAVLRDAGIIVCTRQGKEVYCQVNTAAFVLVLRDLAAALEACCPEGVCPPSGVHR
ncbi:MAG: ArsR/SmtB family transcription factor [Thermoleophilia bacterium]